ncbi:oligosaccharide flippase family protein [Aestuariivirga sp.]|uniref:oligosaccharide flippase family protein n=1 Tax=Aestuariivirga sp. TaxID=2650926 RepID=UPI0039E2B34A
MSGTAQASGLKRRVIQAGWLTLVSHGGTLAIRLVSTILLSRLLAPDAFGLVATIIAIAATMALLSDIGVRDTIIASPSTDDETFLRTAWTIYVLRHILFFLLIEGFAALLRFTAFPDIFPANSLLRDPLMPPLMAVYAFSVLIPGFNSVNLFVLERGIQLKRLVWSDLIVKIIGFTVTLTWALISPTVWALIAGIVVPQIFMLVYTHMLPGPRMAFRWNARHARTLLHNAKWIFVSSTSGIIALQGDKLFLSLILSAHQMGIYSIAATLADVVKALVQKLHFQVTLPVLSEAYRTREAADARSIYYRYRIPIDLLTFFSAGFFLAAGSAIVAFLYDQRYADAGWVLQVLSLSLIPIPFMMVNQAYIANQNWRGYGILSIMQSLSLLVCMGLGYWLNGWKGMIWGIALQGFLPAVQLIMRARAKGWAAYRHELRFLPAYIPGLAAGYAAAWVLPLVKALFRH